MLNYFKGLVRHRSFKLKKVFIQAEQKRLEAETARAIIEKNAKKLAARYVSRALANKADKVLMHAIDKLVPHAKQEIEHSGLIVREVKPMLSF